MLRSASAIAGLRMPTTGDAARLMSSAVCGASAASRGASRADDVFDQSADQPADEFVHEAAGIECRIIGVDARR